MIAAAQLPKLLGLPKDVPLAHGLAYALTDYGRGLEEVILALGRWGFQAMGDPEEGDIITADSMTMDLRTAFAADAAGRLPATVYEARVGAFVLHHGALADCGDGRFATVAEPLDDVH